MVNKNTSMLARVLSVRVQNRNGAIFRAERISDGGEIQDVYSQVVARVQAKAIGVKVVEGQWWRLRGELTTKTFINAGGFEMTEEHLEVGPGGAVLELPDGAHIVDYLTRNKTYKGIGRSTANALVERFSDRLIDVLNRGDYEALTGVVSHTKTKILVEGWKAEGLGETLQWLQAHDIAVAFGRKIIDHFRADAVSKINENPYRLLSFSVGWNEVDRLATGSLGVGMEDSRRLAAAVEEVVYRRFSLGDTFVPRRLLIEGLQKLLGTDSSANALIEESLRAAEGAHRLLFDQSGNGYSLGASILENRVVDAISARLAIQSPACNVDAVISGFEGREGFKLNDEQLAAVHMVANHHFSVITGGAGCGKTTVLNVVCEVLEDQGYAIVQLALAGKAVKRMMDSTRRPALTLANFLSKLRADQENGDDTLCGPTAILIDEASMVDLISFSGLVHGIRHKVKVVLIGDQHQLPPIGPGLILHCLTDGAVPHTELKTPKRFGSEIAAVANNVRDGVLPPLPDDGKVRLLEIVDTEMPAYATDLYLRDQHDTVILTSTRAMAQMINLEVQTRVRGNRPEVRVWNEEYECWEATGLCEQDLVICTRNMWDKGLQNGSIGRIVRLNNSTDNAIGAIEWDDGKTLDFDVGMLDCLELAYALTVHKSQGSQWRRVIVCLPKASRMIDRSLVYTAVTRAKAEVVILGLGAAIADAIGVKKAADRRHVGLPNRLKQQFAVAETTPVSVGSEMSFN